MKRQALSNTQRSHFSKSKPTSYSYELRKKKIQRRLSNKRLNQGVLRKNRYDFIESLSNTTNRNEASELVKNNVKLTKLYNNGPSRMNVGWLVYPCKTKCKWRCYGEKRNYDKYSAWNRLKKCQNFAMENSFVQNKSKWNITGNGTWLSKVYPEEASFQDYSVSAKRFVTLTRH
jgi:hypothetical protein